MGKRVRLLAANNVINLDEVGHIGDGPEPGTQVLPPPAGTTDGYVLTARTSAPSGLDWEAAGASSGLVQSATVILTNSQIKNIKATPVTLVTPAAGTAILPLAGWAIHDYRNGRYTDPDADGYILVTGATSLAGGQKNSSGWGTVVVDTNGNTVDPGASKFFSYLLPTPTDSWTYTIVRSSDNALVQVISEPLVIGKDKGATQEFTGGGTGNTLTIVLYYLAVPTS